MIFYPNIENILRELGNILDREFHRSKIIIVIWRKLRIQYLYPLCPGRLTALFWLLQKSPFTFTLVGWSNQCQWKTIPIIMATPYSFLIPLMIYLYFEYADISSSKTILQITCSGGRISRQRCLESLNLLFQIGLKFLFLVTMISL